MIKNILKMRLQNIIFLYFTASLLVSLALFSTWSIDYGFFFIKALSEDKIYIQICSRIKDLHIFIL